MVHELEKMFKLFESLFADLENVQEFKNLKQKKFKNENGKRRKG